MFRRASSWKARVAMPPSAQLLKEEINARS
jgi:hypothetical protein